MKALFKRFIQNRNAKIMRKLQPVVARINEVESRFAAMTDEELKQQTPRFYEQLDQGAPLDDCLVDAFAVAREAGKRVLGMRAFDVQLLGGLILHRGSIAEMKTGEGKTLTATLPVYLNALERKGVHVVTVNDYLAKRDAEWMGQIYQFLGMDCRPILHHLNDQERKLAYGGHITYGTNNEIGFDYLRDNLKFRPEEFVLRAFHYAIVDEVDSVLIDEARTPLIISGPSEERISKYQDADRIVRSLKPEEHFTVDEKDHHALLTEEGVEEAQRLLKVNNLYDVAHVEMLHCLEQALKAHCLFKSDVDYMVREQNGVNAEIIIVDQHTGRQMPGRRYSDGLHQALEAKHFVPIQQQSQTLASVTFQNFFRMYKKLSGMTGTAETEATEFMNIYGLDVFVIPTNRPMTRDDQHDQIYRSTEEKVNAILQEIKSLHEAGRPVLVGTISIEMSELIAERTKKMGIKAEVLNAKYHEKEAEIVAQAGRKDAVTIATNMAGRGTDILLGGNAEMLAKRDVRQNPTKVDFDERLKFYTAQCQDEKKAVLSAGGLAIIGTERHESRRIDNQLRGRSGRQGDPGSSRFFLSMEDKLMKHFGNPKLQGLLLKSMEEGKPIEHRMVNKAIERAQKSVENRNFDIRKHLLEYDDVMNRQRNTFYALRKSIFERNPRTYIEERAHAILQFLLDNYKEEAREKSADAEKRLQDKLMEFFGYTADLPQPIDAHLNDIREALHAHIDLSLNQKWEGLAISQATIDGAERFFLLGILDRLWKDHMRNMDALKEGIGLQGYAQKDPLIEYKRESFEMYQALLDRMDEETVKFMVRAKRISEDSQRRMEAMRAEEAKAMKMASRNEEDQKPKTFKRDQKKIGPNDPCPCGSGIKYKKCHGKP